MVNSDTEKFKKLFALLDSDQEGEREAALARLYELLNRQGKSFRDVLDALESTVPKAAHEDLLRQYHEAVTRGKGWQNAYDDLARREAARARASTAGAGPARGFTATAANPPPPSSPKPSPSFVPAAAKRRSQWGRGIFFTALLFGIYALSTSTKSPTAPSTTEVSKPAPGWEAPKTGPAPMLAPTTTPPARPPQASPAVLPPAASPATLPTAALPQASPAFLPPFAAPTTLTTAALPQTSPAVLPPVASPEPTAPTTPAPPAVGSPTSLHPGVPEIVHDPHRLDAMLRNPQQRDALLAEIGATYDCDLTEVTQILWTWGAGIDLPPNQDLGPNSSRAEQALLDPSLRSRVLAGLIWGYHGDQRTVSTIWDGFRPKSDPSSTPPG
jgi:hypothetical protein